MDYFNVDCFDVFSGFDLEAYKEVTKPVNFMGGFMDWPEHLHQVQEDD